MLVKKRRHQTHLYVLQVNDRFYFQNDRSKKIWQVQEHTFYFYRYMKLKVTVCMDDHGLSKRFDSKRIVVFMRTKEVHTQLQYLKTLI